MLGRRVGDNVIRLRCGRETIIYVRENRGELTADGENDPYDGYGNEQSNKRILNGGHATIRLSQKPAGLLNQP
jgi:hypothetical protein